MAQRGGKVRLTVMVTPGERAYLEGVAEKRQLSLAYVVREAIRLHMDFFTTQRDSTKPHMLDGNGSL